MKVCNSFELKIPTISELNNIINILLPNIYDNNKLLDNIINFITR